MNNLNGKSVFFRLCFHYSVFWAVVVEFYVRYVQVVTLFYAMSKLKIFHKILLFSINLRVSTTIELT